MEGLNLKPPDEFVESTNSAEAWTKWRQRYEIYALAAGVDKLTDAQQRAILLHTMGTAAYERYLTFSFGPNESGVNQTKENILDKFTEYYQPYQNVTFASHKFNNAIQKPDQTFDQFLAELKRLVVECKFKEIPNSEIEDRLVCDRLVAGIRDNALRERLLRETKLELSKAAEMCRIAESSKQQVKLMSEASVSINSVQRPQIKNKYDSRKQLQRTSGQFKQKEQVEQNGCYKCGKIHKRGSCLAFGQKCYKCGRMNHFAGCCFSKQIASLHVSEGERQDTTESEKELYLDTVMLATVSHSNSENKWYQKVEVNGVQINFKLDTGADINIIPRSILSTMGMSIKTSYSDVNAVSYNREKIPLTAQCVLNCTVKGITKPLNFFIVDFNATPILGYRDCEMLGLIARINTMTNEKQSKEETPSPELQALMEEYRDLFEGLGKFPGLFRLKLKEGTQPHISPPRRIPTALHDKVKQELCRMEQLGVIAKVTEPTEWVNPIVIVEKPDGRIRICLDPRPLNECLERERYLLPTVEEVIEKLAGSTIFTLADVKDGFWHMELDNPSSYLCTFITPWGRFRFLRVPFGLNVAPEMFQRTMNEIFQEVEKTQPYFDDIAAGGVSEADHIIKLRKMFQTSRNHNVKLNIQKLQLGVKKLKLLGHEISDIGVMPDPKKIKAIIDMEAPHDKQELLRFLGMITYLTKFLPGMADKTTQLRLLLKKNVEWVWDSNTEAQFQQLKKLVTSAPVLQFFDPKKAITLTADASSYGLGAALLQDQKPVQYASISLTQTQQNYAQIEKELLSLVYACEHFVNYVYGRQITIETDHKPLLGLVKKPLNSMSTRLQKLLIRLLRFNCTLKYVPGRQLIVADTLSRSPQKGAVVDTSDLDCKQTVYMDLIATDEKTKELRLTTEQDPEMQLLSQLIKDGWPKYQRQVPEGIKHYWPFRNELTIYQDLICLGRRLVVPKDCRRNILNKLHIAHRGVVACKAKARISVFWPSLSKDIEDYIRVCQVCQRHQKSNIQEPLMDYELPTLPWQKVAIDFFKLKGDSFLLVIDYFSKYVEVKPMTSTTAGPVINALKSIFARHGIPELLISDNGPPFESQEMRSFCKQWGISHSPTSPLFPRANGQVERAVGTIKQALTKAAEDKTDLYTVLLDYRITPSGDLPSPAEMSMGRRIRSLIPIVPSLLKPEFPTSGLKTNLKNRQNAQHRYGNNHRKTLPPLKLGQAVWLQHQNSWIEAQIIKVGPQPRSYVVKTSQEGIYRRNRIHLKPRYGTTGEPSVEDHFPTQKEQIPNSVLEEGSEEEHTEEEQVLRTRSGRSVRPPIRLDL